MFRGNLEFLRKITSEVQGFRIADNRGNLV